MEAKSKSIAPTSINALLTREDKFMIESCATRQELKEMDRET